MTKFGTNSDISSTVCLVVWCCSGVTPDPCCLVVQHPNHPPPSPHCPNYSDVQSSERIHLQAARQLRCQFPPVVVSEVIPPTVGAVLFTADYVPYLVRTHLGASAMEKY